MKNEKKIKDGKTGGIIMFHQGIIKAREIPKGKQPEIWQEGYKNSPPG